MSFRRCLKVLMTVGGFAIIACSGAQNNGGGGSSDGGPPPSDGGISDSGPSDGGPSDGGISSGGILHARHRDIVDANGHVVPLRGFNLGGWMVFEKWMTPMDSGSLKDAYEVIQTLDSRFGVASEQALIKTYQENWITTLDLDNIEKAGYNALRVPVWYGNFYALNDVSDRGWRADAFERLDWLVSNAASRGIYVIIDMHGAVGGQSNESSTGHGDQNAYWTNAGDQQNTKWMWQQIANHYKGNAAVAGYDLLNEPMNAPSAQAVLDAYNSLYGAIRAIDPDHLIFMEGTFGNWNWSMLPPPSQYGWTNVAYEMHVYTRNGTEPQVRAGSDKQVADFQSHASYDVPGFIGEFNDFDYPPSTFQYSIDAYDKAGMSWALWAYKATAGLDPNPWGFYDPTSKKAIPDIAKDEASTISSDWQQWTTAQTFVKNTTNYGN